jgi:hypothetical protein
MFIILHILALLFFPLALFVTIPMHIISANAARREKIMLDYMRHNAMVGQRNKD